MPQIMKAKPLVQQTLEQLKQDCQKLVDKGVRPRMEVLLVGNHRPSQLYTSRKKKFCESFGAECVIHKLPEDVSEKDFTSKLAEIAHNPLVHGCFVQLPLPKHLQHLDIAHMIPPKKDVDGFHPENLYQVLLGTDQGLKPCTPSGIMQLLRFSQIDVQGKHVVIIGRSMIVGKPLSLMMNSANATVTLCHSRTQNLKELTKQADIIVSAIGKPRYLDKSYLDSSREQVVIDVGINHDDAGQLCGDVNAEDIQESVHAYSPVPGGVGPLTILALSQNLLQAAKNLL